MSARRRGRSGPPPARKPKSVPARKKRGPGPSDATIERAIAASLKRNGWAILELQRQGVQRRGRDLSMIFRARLQKAEVVRRSTVVAHVTEKRPPGGIRPVIADGHRVFVWRYPSDPFLPGLPRVTSNAKVTDLLAEFGGPTGRPNLSRRVYRATRRAVIQADLLGETDDEVLDTIYFKVLGDRDPVRIAKRTSMLAEQHRILGEHLPVPGLVGLVADDGILAIANVPGVTLRKAILDEEHIPTPAAVAGLAITLADLEVPSDADPVRYADATRHAATIGELLPKEKARVKGLVDACVVEGPLVTVHGDFHDGQVLVADGSISGVIDIDGVGLGYFAHDAGRIIAYVESVGDIERADQTRVDGFVAGLRDAFADHVEDDVLARAVGAAWVALATGPHRRQQKNWEASTVRRLDHAERWLRGAGAM